jgi:hypothetical protein
MSHVQKKKERLLTVSLYKMDAVLVVVCSSNMASLDQLDDVAWKINACSISRDMLFVSFYK